MVDGSLREKENLVVERKTSEREEAQVKVTIARRRALVSLWSWGALCVARTTTVGSLFLTQWSSAEANS